MSLDSLDDDSGLHVLLMLSRSEQSLKKGILSLRSVNRRWHALASHDSLWRPLFRGLFGPNVYGDADVSRTRKEDKPIASDFSINPYSDNGLHDERTLVEDEGQDDDQWVSDLEPDDSWCSHFFRACHHLPLLNWTTKHEAAVLDPYRHQARLKSSSVACCHLSLPHYPLTRAPYRMHRLAAILALLDSPFFDPRSLVCLGFPGDFETTTLARFCYAFVHGKEWELLEQLNVTVPQEDRDDTMGRLHAWSRRSEPSLGMLVDGVFVPFVYFLTGVYGKRLQLTDPEAEEDKETDLYEFIDDSVDLIGKDDQITSAFLFEAPERGWAPHFFNASFSWFRYAVITTKHNRSRGEILALLSDQEYVW